MALIVLFLSYCLFSKKTIRLHLMEHKKRKKIFILALLIVASFPALFYFLRLTIVYFIPQSIFESLIVKYINTVGSSLAKYDYVINYKYFFYSFTLLPIKYIEVDKNKALFSYQRRNTYYIIKRVNEKSQEDQIASKLDHPNIVKIVKTFRSKYKSSEYGYIIMEHLDFDIDFDYVKADQKIIRNISKDILNAIQYLHNQKIAHLDVKIENIMGKHTKAGVVYKLIDFGYSKYIFDEYLYIKNKNLGTFPYKSPEIVFDNCHSLKSDIWSYGVTLYYLLIDKFLFFDDDDEFLFEKYKYCIKNGKINLDAIKSTRFYELIKRCITSDFRERPDIRQIAELWIKNLS